VRGCLFVVLLGAVVIGLVAIIGLPAVASGAVTAALTANGLHAADTRVTVTSNPPTAILGLHADRIRVHATDATWNDLRIGTLDLDLRDVSLVDRKAGTVAGLLDTVVVHKSDPEDPLDGLRMPVIRIAGSGKTVDATATLDGPDVEALVARAVEQKTKQQPESVALESPGRLVIRMGGLSVAGALAVASDGSLVLRPDGAAGALLGEITLVDAAGLPFRLRTVRVVDGDLVLDGTLAGLLP